MKKIIKSLGILSLAVVLGFSVSSCDDTEPLVPPSPGPGETEGFENNYYNEDNFIEENKEVNSTKVVYYEGPTLLESSELVDIKVENESLFVYETRVNHRRTFSFDYSTDVNPVALFDFEGKVHVDITFNNVSEITSAKISPLIYGITPEASGNTLSFDLSYNDNYIVEINGDSENVVHLFANPLETDPITKEEAEKDDSIIYFGPGLYEAGAIPIESNTTVYLAGGAYVYGKIRMEDVENVTIRGRGIISGSIYDRRSANESTIPVEVRTSKNVNFEGLTFLDPAGWCFALYHSEDIEMENIKIITARGNGDGISVQSCKNVMVKGGFVRSWDDSLVVKNEDRGITSNVTFDGVNVWTDLAQSMEVGYETNGLTMDSITFKNITVIHNFHKPVISMHNCDDATITNVKYENITLEDGQMLGDVRDDGENDFFIDFTIAYNAEWTESAGKRGKIDGVNIENVKVYKIADTVISRMNGEDETSSINNVTISNIDYAGKNIDSIEDLGLLTNNYVYNLKVDSPSENSEILGAIKTLPYKLNLTSDSVSKTLVETTHQEGVLVPDFAYRQGDAPYIGESIDQSGVKISATHGVGTTNRAEYDDGTGDFYNSEYPLSNVIDKNYETYIENASWKDEEDEFMALTFDFGSETKYIGTIRLHGIGSNEFKFTYRISIFGKKLKSDGTINENFTRVLASNDYDVSPANGNTVDIGINPDYFGAIQLRLFRVSDSISATPKYQISEIEFYEPSFTYLKPIVASTEHNDVYVVSNVVDGSTAGSSYYESKSVPAYLIIDLQAIRTMKVLVLSLCPELTWQTRVQNIEISGNSENISYNDSMTFETIVAAKDYTFDPKEGNNATLTFENGVSLRYLKIQINSNTINGDSKYGAQLAEVSAY